MVRRELSVEEIDWIVGISIKSPPWITTAYCAAGMFSNYEKESQEVDKELKTLFIVAEESAEKASDYLQTKLPNADVCYLGGHFMFWEFPYEFNAALETYLCKL